MVSKFSLNVLFILHVSICISQEYDSIPESIYFNASYTGDIVANFSGGIRTGTCYLGLAHIEAGINFESLGLWKGGQFNVHGTNTHGAMPSSELTGDFQIVSNIEAGEHTFIQELWYRQTFKRLELTAGLQDLNVDFASCGTASDFLNSSFGMLPTLSGNIPTPIFPLTTLGISAKIKFSPVINFLAAVFDGCPTSFTDNPHNLNWKLDKKDGILAVYELQFSFGKEREFLLLKTGLFTHRHFQKEKEIPTKQYKLYSNTGFYLLASSALFNINATDPFEVFFQFGSSPSELNRNSYYVGAGFTVKGLMNIPGGDMIGLSVAHAGMAYGDETTIEMTLKIPCMKYLYVQPDLQYIINPSGTGAVVPHCFAGLLRFGFSF